MQGKRWRRILVVDDDGAIRRVVRRILASRVEVIEADSCEAALQILEQEAPALSVVLLDIRFPRGILQGDQALGCIRERWPALGVVVMTVENDIPLACRCLKLGALDYVTKFPDLEGAVVAAVDRALAIVALRRENEELERALQQRRAAEQALVADTHASVLPLEPRPEQIRRFEDVTREHFSHALRACNGNMSEAARRLGVPYDSFRNRVVGWGLVRRTSKRRRDE
ncbi:MAG TPA: response regulator [Polyangia bacterium]